jgi:hypothetical protein
MGGEVILGNEHPAKLVVGSTGPEAEFVGDSVFFPARRRSVWAELLLVNPYPNALLVVKT